jgi:opacity protein-like surface antigen
MQFKACILLGTALCAMAPMIAHADENSDLDLIPKEIQENQPPPGQPTVPYPEGAPPPPPSAAAPGKFYLENAATVSSLRNNLVVPFPPPRPFDWENRTSLDAVDQWNLASNLTAALSNRFNITEADGVPFPTHQNLRNDFREGFLTWQPAPQSYLEAGRINLRNGVALGFNPTDFFKTRTQIDQASLDPSVIREDRLGTVMARAQQIFSGGAASIAIAPKIENPAPIPTGLQSGFDPRFNRTNAAYRFLASANYDFDKVSPQALVYHEGTQTRFGLDLTSQVSQSVIAYAEWAGGRQQDLIGQAISFGKETGTLPANARILPPDDASNAFRNDVAVGASWTGTDKITINLEYHYHQAGLSGETMRSWFAIGSAAPRSAIPGELWFIRAYAADQQQPFTRQQVFLRASWTDAFVSDLDLSAFTFVNLYDGSTLSQIAANYYLSNNWTLGAYVSANLGSLRSERGSFPQEASAIIQLVRYF